MLKQLLLWANGNVMAYDENGDQICELQRLGVTVEELKTAAESGTEFGLGLFWDGKSHKWSYINLPAENFWSWAELAQRALEGGHKTKI